MLGELLRNKAALLVQYGANGLLPLLMVPHILSTIGPYEFGRIAVAMSLGGIGASIVQFSFPLFGPKLLADSERADDRNAIFVAVTLTKILLFALVVVITALGIAVTRMESELVAFAIVSALAFAAASNSAWILQFENRFALVATLSVVGVVCAVVVGFVFVSAESEWSTWFSGLTLVTGPAVVGGLSLAVASFGVRARRRRALLADAGKLIRQGAPLFASQFFAALYGGAGAVVIASLLGIEAAGRYGAFERILTAVIGICTLIHIAAYPRLVQAYERDFTLYRRLLATTVAVYFSLALIIVAVTIGFGEWIFWHMFHGAIDTTDPRVVAGGLLLLTSIFGPLLTGYFVVRGEQRRVLGLTFRLLVISLVLGLPGTKFLGAWAWMGALAVAQVVVLAEGIIVFNREVLIRERAVS